MFGQFLSTAPAIVGLGLVAIVIVAMCLGIVALSRRSTDALLRRQGAQIKLLSDRVAALQQGLTDSRSIIQSLAQANRKLAADLGHVAEAVEEAEAASPSAPTGRGRILH
jgi:hypothetical protein